MLHIRSINDLFHLESKWSYSQFEFTPSSLPMPFVCSCLVISTSTIRKWHKWKLPWVGIFSFDHAFAPLSLLRRDDFQNNNNNEAKSLQNKHPYMYTHLYLSKANVTLILQDGHLLLLINMIIQFALTLVALCLNNLNFE